MSKKYLALHKEVVDKKLMKIGIQDNKFKQITPTDNIIWIITFVQTSNLMGTIF